MVVKCVYDDAESVPYEWVYTRKWDISSINPSFNYQVAINLTWYPHLLLICQLAPPLSSKKAPTHLSPWCEAVISSFLFNPLLLVCAFPPFVSMAMPSALHQELRPAFSLISLSVLTVSVFTHCPLRESHSLISQHVFFCSVLKSDLPTLLFLLLLPLYFQLFVCLLSFSYLFSPFFYTHALPKHWFPFSVCFPNHPHFHFILSGSYLVLWPLSIFISQLRSLVQIHPIEII